MLASPFSLGHTAQNANTDNGSEKKSEWCGRTIEKMPTMKMEKWCCKNRPNNFDRDYGYRKCKHVHTQKTPLTNQSDEKDEKRKRAREWVKKKSTTPTETQKCKSIIFGL